MPAGQGRVGPAGRRHQGEAAGPPGGSLVPATLLSTPPEVCHQALGLYDNWRVHFGQLLSREVVRLGTADAGGPTLAIPATARIVATDRASRY